MSILFDDFKQKKRYFKTLVTDVTETLEELEDERDLGKNNLVIQIGNRSKKLVILKKRLGDTERTVRHNVF